MPSPFPTTLPIRLPPLAQTTIPNRQLKLPITFVLPLVHPVAKAPRPLHSADPSTLTERTNARRRHSLNSSSDGCPISCPTAQATTSNQLPQSDLPRASCVTATSPNSSQQQSSWQFKTAMAWFARTLRLRPSVAQASMHSKALRPRPLHPCTHLALRCTSLRLPLRLPSATRWLQTPTIS